MQYFIPNISFIEIKSFISHQQTGEAPPPTEVPLPTTPNCSDATCGEDGPPPPMGIYCEWPSAPRDFLVFLFVPMKDCTDFSEETCVVRVGEEEIECFYYDCIDEEIACGEEPNLQEGALIICGSAIDQIDAIDDCDDINRVDVTVDCGDIGSDDCVMQDIPTY